MKELDWNIVVRKQNIEVKVLFAGADLNVIIAGGEIPHIGSVSIAQPRASLTGKGSSATVSNYVFSGHKDDVIGNMFAKELAAETGQKTVVSCGIHYDGLEQEEIQTVYEEMKRLSENIVDELKR